MNKSLTKAAALGAVGCSCCRPVCNIITCISIFNRMLCGAKKKPLSDVANKNFCSQLKQLTPISSQVLDCALLLTQEKE